MQTKIVGYVVGFLLSSAVLGPAYSQSCLDTINPERSSVVEAIRCFKEQLLLPSLAAVPKGAIVAWYDSGANVPKG